MRVLWDLNRKNKKLIEKKVSVKAWKTAIKRHFMKMLSLNNNCEDVQCLVSALFQKGINLFKVNSKRVFKSVFWRIVYTHIVPIHPYLTYTWLECHILNYWAIYIRHFKMKNHKDISARTADNLTNSYISISAY